MRATDCLSHQEELGLRAADCLSHQEELRLHAADDHSHCMLIASAWQVITEVEAFTAKSGGRPDGSTVLLSRAWWVPVIRPLMTFDEL